MGMTTVRSGSALREMVTLTVSPSSTFWDPWPYCTVTEGSSSSSMTTIVSSLPPGLTRASGIVPNFSSTLSSSSSTVSWEAVKVMVFSVSPLLKVTLVGTE